MDNETIIILLTLTCILLLMLLVYIEYRKKFLWRRVARMLKTGGGATHSQSVLPEPSIMQKATEQGWTNCLQQLQIQKDIVFYGDSLVRWGKWQEWFPEVNQICNLGLGGDTVVGAIRRLPMLLTLRPKKVFIMLGINYTRQPLSEYKDNYEELVQSIQEQLPETKLYIMSILPIHHSRFEEYSDNEYIQKKNVELKSIALQQHLTYINLYERYVDTTKHEMPYHLTRDGLHLTEDGYMIWRNVIQKYIYE